MVQIKSEQDINMHELDELDINSDNEMEEKETESDADECDEIELQKAFSKTYSLTTEKALSLSKNYILHLSCTNESSKICAGLSSNVCEIYSLSNSQINKDITLKNHSNNIINVKFGNDNNTLFTGSSDCIKLWDLRTPSKPAIKFKDESEDQDDQKPLLHFDVSPNNRLLCGSTELHKGDSFLLFWDIRKNGLLGGYWESHSDDITRVMFHHTDNNKLASGSTDGLVNIYNLEETNEDDALLNSLNTDSTVEQIMWYSTDNEDSICCVTHTADVHLWDAEAATPYKTFSRRDVAKAIKRKSADHCYVANAHVSNSDSLFLLAGSNWHKGECIRAVNVENNENLIPYFKLANNKQRIRTSWYNKENEMLVTGGEQCILSIWQESKGEIKKSLQTPTKAKTKKRITPY